MKLCSLIVLITLTANTITFAKETKPMYKLPKQVLVSTEKTSESKAFIAGSSKGLFKISNSNSAIPLWTDGSVEQILRAEVPTEDGKFKEIWYFRTNEGILFSSDLENFELRNDGLPFLTLKNYDGENTTFQKQVHMLKDICVNPMNANQIVTATKDNVYLSKDGGKNWKSIGSMSRGTTGIKAVGIATMPLKNKNGSIGSELVVFMSHPIYGFAYILPDGPKPVWKDINTGSCGIELLKSMPYPDEIADILPVMKLNSDGSFGAEIFLSQSYIPRVYKFNWDTKLGECIYKGSEPAETIDGLTNINGDILFTRNGGFGSVNMDTYKIPGIPEKAESWKKSLACIPGTVSSAWVPATKSGFKKGVCLNELWLLYPGTYNTKYAETAKGKKSIYVSAYQCRLQSGIDKFKKVIQENKLNSLVIDMKDDYGLLRYDSKDPLVMKKGKVTQYAVDLDHFVQEFKKDNIYLIARIVVFKDRNLAKYGNSKYAIWNRITNSPWIGIKGYEEQKDEATGEVKQKVPVYYDENWVDPYSPEVWEYNVAIAKELISRGFDEIQFDYIRFPTDGYNLNLASCRWKSEGMDKESALVSFLRYARANIDAPIGIDIYGANGWYRCGARTGQDVELMAAYVDVIGPMFYPSHFEQNFMSYEPFEDRTYRIYFYGTYRNTIMGRNRVLVRPWVQAFYLNVSYDRKYYNKDYVLKEIYGVRDSVDQGYMYWNNSGEYGMISPDISKDDIYPGTTPEASPNFRKPALGSEIAPAYNDGGISLMDSIYHYMQNNNPETKTTSPLVPLLLSQ